jgi:hypothetical protein
LGPISLSYTTPSSGCRYGHVPPAVLQLQSSSQVASLTESQIRIELTAAALPEEEEEMEDIPLLQQSPGRARRTVSTPLQCE